MNAMPVRRIVRAVEPPEEREPPHSAEAEQSVIGGLLIDGSAWPKVADLTASDFYRDEHRSIFATLGCMLPNGEAADVITVHDHLQRAGKAEACGGIAYLNSIAQSVASAANIGRYAEIVREHSIRRQAIAEAGKLIERIHTEPDPAATLAEAGDRLAALGAERASAPAPFAPVSLDDLGRTEPVGYWWQGYMPERAVTMLGGHGGAGKSTLMLMACACIAVGAPLLGVPTRRGRVVLFSAEDSARVLRLRLHTVCTALGLDPSEVGERLRVLDATEGDAALYREATVAGVRCGSTTPTYAALMRELDAFGADVLAVDNASDCFDASEIDRARVRAFMRALVATGRAVLLAVHVDKASARGDRSGSESYSGSTAWHNSARSRLFLARKDDGTLTLEHAKHNLGPRRDPLTLCWPAGGVPQVDAPLSGFVQHIADANDTKALLRLIREFSGRGEFVATAPNSPSNAARLFAGEPDFPKRGKASEVFALLRDAERSGLIERQTYRTADRKPHERWSLTATGCARIGVAAPSAPSAPSPEDGADGTHGAWRAPSAPSAHGGYGGAARAQNLARDDGNGLPA